MLQVVQRLAGRLRTLSVWATVLTPGGTYYYGDKADRRNAQEESPKSRRQSPQRGGQSRNDATGRDPDVPSGRRPRHGGATQTRPAERTRARIAVARGQPRVREGRTVIQEDNPTGGRNRIVSRARGFGHSLAASSTCPAASSTGRQSRTTSTRRAQVRERYAVPRKRGPMTQRLKCCGRCGRIRPRQPLPQSTRHAGNAAAHAPGAHNANASSNETGPPMHHVEHGQNAAPRRNRSRCHLTCGNTINVPDDEVITVCRRHHPPRRARKRAYRYSKRAHRQSRGLEASPLGGGSSDWRARAYPPRRPRAVPSSITRTRGGVLIVKPHPARRTPRQLSARKLQEDTARCA